MTRLVYAKVVSMYRDLQGLDLNAEPSRPTDPERFMHVAFAQYLQKVDTRQQEKGVSKEDLLEKEGRGISLFKEKWHRAFSHWYGKIRDDAGSSATEESPDVTIRRSFDEVLASVQSFDVDDTSAVRALAVEATHFDSIQREKLLKAINARAAVGIGVLRKIAASSLASSSDQLTLARSVIAEYGSDDMIFKDDALWLWSKCGVWRKVDERVVKLKLQSMAEGKVERVTAALVNGALDLLKSEVMSSDQGFNLGDPETVNCLNGEIELRSSGWSLVPHRRELFRTTQIPVAYDPKAKAPRFTQFLEEVFRDDPDRTDKSRCLLEMIGYTLMSHTELEKFMMLIGGGANGKSVALALVGALCGRENVAAVQPATLAISFHRAHLDQKLVNIVTELPQGATIPDAELKAITSGEATTVERKFCNPYVMRPFATCWFGTNHMPHTRDFSAALFRRAVILTFNRAFHTHEQDTRLKEKLEAELPGILNMALDAYASALLVGFTEPESSKAAKEEWRFESDQVSLFVEECCLQDGAGSETIEHVYRRYEHWARDQGISRAVSKKGLRERLTRLGFGAKRTSTSRQVVGLTLRETSWSN